MTKTVTTDIGRTRAGDPPSQPERRPKVWPIALVASAGIFVGYLPIMAASVGLSAIARSTHASSTDLEWVISLLVLPMAALILTFGAWADRYGRRKVFIAGLVLSLIGGVVAMSAGAVSGSGAIKLLWVGQGIAGAGAAALIPATLSIISHAQPDPKKRATLIALWTAAMMLAMAAGSYLSAAILSSLSWNWLFLPTSIAAVIVLIVGIPFVPESRLAAGGRLDKPGQILTALGVAALVYGVIIGGSDGYSDPKSIVALIIGAAAIVGFVLVEVRSDQPLLDLRVFRNVNFAAAALVAIIAMFAYLGVNFGLAQYFSALHLSPFEIANRYLVLIAGSIVGSNVAGAFIRRAGPRAVLWISCVWTGVALLVLSTIKATSNAWDTDWRLALMGIGIGAILATVTAAAVNSVPLHQAGMASAAINAVRQTGGALGPAVFSILAASWALHAVPGKLVDHGVGGQIGSTVNDLVTANGVQAGAAIAGQRFSGSEVPRALAEAQTHGFSNTALFAGIVFLVLGAGCAALFGWQARARRSPEEELVKDA